MKTRFIKITPTRWSKEAVKSAIKKCKEYLNTLFPNAESITSSSGESEETKIEYPCPHCSKNIPPSIISKCDNFWLWVGDLNAICHLPCCNKTITIAEVFSCRKPPYRLVPLEITCFSNKHPLSTLTEKEQAKVEEILECKLNIISVAW